MNTYTDYSARPVFKASSTMWMRQEWIAFLGLMVIAAFLRIVFFTGYFGSDEVTYTASAFNLLDGDWTVSTYVGANRYGVNLPVAAFTYLFGRSEFAANLYSLMCSLGEIALVFYFGCNLIGLRAATLATVILAFLPLHAHYAGRIMADAPLALMMTASFLFFWDGETRGKVLSFVIAGLGAGFSFWIKPVAVVYLGVFFVYPVIFWHWNRQWFWMIGVFALAVLGNFVFTGLLAGNLSFLYDALYGRQTSGYLEDAAMQGSGMMSGAGYYLSYLLFKIYHTWLLGFLAVAALAFWWARRNQIPQKDHTALMFLSWWAVGLIVVFSFFIVSLEPLIWIPKQTNYMLMFVAPLALLAGYTIAQLRRLVFWIAIGAVVVPSTFLIALEQNTIRAFTANSKAAVFFSKEHVEADVYADTNGFRAGLFYNLTNSPRAVTVKFLGELMDPSNDSYYQNETDKQRYAIVNLKTMKWIQDEPIQNISQVPTCWIRVGKLEPEGLGVGWRVSKILAWAVNSVPVTLHPKIAKRLDQVTQPGTAYVYRIPLEGCRS